MSHHFAENPKALLEEMKRRFGMPEGLGATGRFPRGKLAPHDEGEIKIGIAADPESQTIIIDFGKPIASIGFSPKEAQGIIDTLTAKLMELRGIT